MVNSRYSNFNELEWDDVQRIELLFAHPEKHLLQNQQGDIIGISIIAYVPHDLADINHFNLLISIGWFVHQRFLLIK